MFLMLSLSSFLAVGQASKGFSLIVKGDSTVKELKKVMAKKQTFKSLEEMNKSITDLIFSLNLAGYLAAEVDSQSTLLENTYCYISTHKAYHLLQISIADSMVVPILPEMIRDNQKTNWPARWKIYTQLLLSHYENNGYPFASIRLQPLTIEDSGITCKVLHNKNEYIVYDTFDLIGDAQVHKKYLEKYLSIKNGEAYNEEMAEAIDRKLGELPWVELMKPTEIFFVGNKAMIRLYINKKQAGTFDAILGLAPGSELNNQKLLITGEAHLKLLNLFSRGYGLELDYTSYRASSREFKAKAFIPYLFGTSIGTEGNFNLVKFDSLYIEAISDIGLLYQVNANKYMKLYFKNQSVSLLQYDTQEVISNNKLPDFNDITTRRYGIFLRQNKLDNSRNPRKGWSTDLDFAAGTKKIGEVEGIKQLGLYKNISLKAIQYQYSVSIKWFMPLSKNLVWHIQAKAAQVYSPQVFYNDLYRIGGLKTLRGFDEQSIFASAYVIGNTEIRYLFGRYSNALIFFNGGWWENNSINIYKNGLPIGLGIGSNIETKSGVFSIYYALGKSVPSSFVLKNGKVHFGFISYF